MGFASGECGDEDKEGVDEVHGAWLLVLKVDEASSLWNYCEVFGLS